MYERNSLDLGKILLSALVGLIVALVIVVGLNQRDPETPSGTTDHGDWHIYRTTEEEEYIGFLEKFDESKYEIVDISVSIKTETSKYGSDEFYIITYKTIESD